MDRPTGIRSVSPLSPQSYGLKSRFSRSTCRTDCRGGGRYSRDSSTSSCSSSDSCSSRRHRRFDKFRNESYKSLDRRYETKENYSSVKKHSRYTYEDSKTRRRNVHESNVESRGYKSLEATAEGYHSEYPSCYKSYEFYKDLPLARSPDKKHSSKSNDGDVGDHVTPWSPGRQASLSHSTSEDEVIRKGWESRSRSRSKSRSSSGQYRRFDKFRTGERREKSVVSDRKGRYDYREVKRPESRQALSERIEHTRVKCDKVVEEKPCSNSSRLSEPRKEKSKKRKCKTQESTRTSRFSKDHKDDEQSKPHIRVNDFNLSFNSSAIPCSPILYDILISNTKHQLKQPCHLWHTGQEMCC